MAAQRVLQQIGEYFSVPSAGGCLGIRTLWSNEFDPIIEDGVRCAETWLDGSSLPLWWVIAQSRNRHRRGDSQEGFEDGFLLRLQQALGTGHEARVAPSQSTSFDA
jgi:hypothetical protein